VSPSLTRFAQLESSRLEGRQRRMPPLGGRQNRHWTARRSRWVWHWLRAALACLARRPGDSPSTSRLGVLLGLAGQRFAQQPSPSRRPDPVARPSQKADGATGGPLIHLPLCRSGRSRLEPGSPASSKSKWPIKTSLPNAGTAASAPTKTRGRPPSGASLAGLGRGNPSLLQEQGARERNSEGDKGRGSHHGDPGIRLAAKQPTRSRTNIPARYYRRVSSVYCVHSIFSGVSFPEV